MDNQLFLKAKQVKRLEAIKEYIADSLDNDLSISVLAERFKIGASTLRYHVNAYFGQTVHRYVITCRINKAKLLLENNNKAIAEISMIVGFGDRTAFARAFKKHVGCSLLQYARRAYFSMRKQTLTNSSTIVTKSDILDSLPGT